MEGLTDNISNIFKPGSDGHGGGAAWGVGGLVLGALLGNRGGLFGNNGESGLSAGQAAFDQSLLNGITGLTAAVPTVGLQTQNAIQSSIGSLALGTQQGLGNVKDAVQGGNTVLLNQINGVNTAVLTSALTTANTIANDGEKTRALIQSINDANLQRELGVAQSALAEERTSRRVRDVEVNVSQTVNQAQAQAQQQAQLQGLFSALTGLANDLQLVRQGQTIFNSGTMAASGTQTAANTRVN